MNHWKYNPTLDRWEITIGDWHATVTKAGTVWISAIERDHERHDGPDTLWPQEGRAWCIEEIARRRALDP